MREIVMIIMLGASVGALILQYVELMLIRFEPEDKGKKKHRGDRNV